MSVETSTGISLDGLARFACQCTDFPPGALIWGRTGLVAVLPLAFKVFHGPRPLLGALTYCHAERLWLQRAFAVSLCQTKTERT